MPEFHNFMMRHGEFGVQEIIERIERVEGIAANTNIPLEQRWANLALKSAGSQPSKK